MGGTSAIEWTNQTWNPVVGCTQVSAGCEHCYALTLHNQRHANYLKHEGYWRPDGRAMPLQYAHPFSTMQLLPERLDAPLHIRKPCRIFVNSMSDLFHSQVPDTYIERVFAVMEQASWHTFQILTKRPGRLRRLGLKLRWPANVWIGVSIENDVMTPRADVLRLLPAAVRFLSCEPLLGPLPSLDLTGIDWVIVGGESGSGARLVEGEWIADLRDRCLDAQVAFFFKQWGGRTAKAGGRLLDGVYWDQYPQPTTRYPI